MGCIGVVWRWFTDKTRTTRDGGLGWTVEPWNHRSYSQFVEWSVVAAGLGNPSRIEEDSTSNPLPDKEPDDLEQDSE
jgi:hypothetical protein